MNVTAQFPGVRFVLDQDGFESALIEAAFAVVKLVEEGRIAAVQIMHAFGQIRLGRS